MKRTNLPTIAAVVIAVGLAVALVYYAFQGDQQAAQEKKGEGKKFEVVTQAPKAAEFELAPVPEGEKLDLTAVLRDPQGNEALLSDLVQGRALITLMDTDLKDRRAKAATRNLRRLIKGGAELAFPVVVILPEGTSDEEAADFARKRQLATPMYVDSDGEFAARTGWDLREGALVAADGTILRKFERSEAWDERFGSEPPINDDVLFWAWDIPEKGPEIPEDASPIQPPAALASGVELLASRLPPTAEEGGILNIHTWWRVSGPVGRYAMPAFHIETAGETPRRGLPWYTRHDAADWTVPLHRLEPGDVVEDRYPARLQGLPAGICSVWAVVIDTTLPEGERVLGEPCLLGRVAIRPADDR